MRDPNSSKIPETLNNMRKFSGLRKIFSRDKMYFFNF